MIHVLQAILFGWKVKSSIYVAQGDAEKYLDVVFSPIEEEASSF